MFKVLRTSKEIEDLMDKAYDSDMGGSNFPGMTYEQGITAVIEWLESDEAYNPLDD
jgi:hypothetical protein